MSKDANYIGQPVLSQLLTFIDKRSIDKLAKAKGSDRYTKKFTTYDHLVTMLYCVFHRCDSLREVTTGMQACFKKLNHLGMRYCPRRSTLSDANKRRDAEVFKSIYELLYTEYASSLSDSREKKELLDRLYIADSSTITLFKEILKGAGRTPYKGRQKGGMKVHTLIKANEDVPCMIKMTAAAKHDVTFIKKMKLPSGSIITFDKGYRSYAQYELWSKEHVSWVTRLTNRSKYEVQDDFWLTDTQISKGILADQLIKLGHDMHKQGVQIEARMVSYYDSSKDKLFYFITNNLILEPETIASIYKHRWQIEILFKRLKQNYPLQYFLGDNENALKIQVWCTLIADLIIKIIKSRLKKTWAHTNLVSMVRLHLMSYFGLFNFLENPDKSLINDNTHRKRIPDLFNST